MSFESARPGIPTINPGFLPIIIDVKAVRVRYERPRVYYLHRQRRWPARQSRLWFVPRTTSDLEYLARAFCRRSAARRVRRGGAEFVSFFRV